MMINKIRKSGHIKQGLIYIRSSLWFVPTLIIAGMVALAFGLIELDQHVDKELNRWWPSLFATQAEGARSMLSAIAGAMATVAGVVFSITIVALTLASSQYTSRVLRNFMRDPVTQSMLGVFVGAYIYCLIVLHTISGGDGAFVPALAVLNALLLAIFASCFFIFFIHHISSTIQASEMAAAITRESLQAIDHLFPEEVGREPGQTIAVEISSGTRWHAVPAPRAGYVQGLDTDALIDFARHYNTVVRMECGIGDFVAPDRPLASLALATAPSAEMVAALHGIYAIDNYRTIDQDAAFGIRQLVDMSLKALSPGINDTTTAGTCIEYLSVLLTRCAQRGMAPRERFDGNELRIIAHRPEFKYLVSLAFNQILENAEGNTEIIRQLLKAITQIAGATRDPQRLAVLRRHVDTIEEVAMRSAKSAWAKEEIVSHLEQARRLLD